MADLFINVDFSSVTGNSHEQANKGNRKHQQFLRKRKFLEKRGFIRQSHHKLPNRKPEQQRNSWDHNKQNGQANSNKGSHGRTDKQNNNAFHQQGASDTSSRTVTVGTQRQSSMLSVSLNCAPNKPHSASASKGHNSTKEPTNPSIQLPSSLSEYESNLSFAKSTPSYKIVAIDCEMVGTGLKGRESALARCSIVSYQGDVVYDKYIKPTSPVTDYRTRWSGIRRQHLVNATPFSVAQKEVLKLLHGKLVIGHAIQNDYKALCYFHPKEMTRDTSKIPLLNRKAGFPERETASLKRLAKHVLNKDIQMGRSGHSSVEDAKTTMELYRVVEAEYESELATGTVHQ